MLGPVFGGEVWVWLSGLDSTALIILGMLAAFVLAMLAFLSAKLALIAGGLGVAAIVCFSPVGILAVGIGGCVLIVYLMAGHGGTSISVEAHGDNNTITVGRWE